MIIEREHNRKDSLTRRERYSIYFASGAFLIAGLMGCVTFDYSEPPQQVQELEPLRRAFISLRQVQTGMTPQEVRAVLGDKVVVGYELLSPEADQYRPLTIDNPYRRETFQKGNDAYEVEYYIAGVQTPDDQITDDELIPLVFENGKLKGSGWKYLQKVRS